MLVEVDFKNPVEAEEFGKQPETFPGLWESLQDESGSLSQTSVTMSR